MGWGDFFKGYVKRTQSLASNAPIKDNAGFLDLMGRGTSKAAQTAAQTAKAGSNKSIQTIYDAVNNADAGNFIGDALGKRQVLDDLRKAMGESGSIRNLSTEGLIDLQNRMSSAIDASGLYKGANVTGGYKGLLGDAGIKYSITGSGSPHTVRDMFNPNVQARFNDYANTWLSGTMADGTINTTARTLRRGAAIGGGLIAGGMILGGDGRGAVIGGAAGGVAVAANALGNS